jgi:hypothetical protein
MTVFSEFNQCQLANISATGTTAHYVNGPSAIISCALSVLLIHNTAAGITSMDGLTLLLNTHPNISLYLQVIEF